MRVGIVGLGPAGIIALQMVRAEGALAVVAIDMLPERLELARTLGADQVVRIEPGTPAAELEREPLQASIDCTGTAHGVQVALDHTVGGPVSPFGVIHGEAIYTTRHWRNRTSIAPRVAPDLPQALIDVGFDPNDRNFAALANRQRIPVVDAVDSDWVDVQATLRRCEITVKQLCGGDIERWFEP